MKAEYIDKIVSLLNKCNDIPLLDLVYRILWKSMKGEENVCGKLN